jgi:hypothetical protein
MCILHPNSRVWLGGPDAGESVRDRPKHSGVHSTLRLLPLTHRDPARPRLRSSEILHSRPVRGTSTPSRAAAVSGCPSSTGFSGIYERLNGSSRLAGRAAFRRKIPRLADDVARALCWATCNRRPGVGNSENSCPLSCAARAASVRSRIGHRRRLQQ